MLVLCNFYSYELYPFFIFTIYQNYTLALIRQSQQRPFHPYGPSSSLGQGLAATLKCDKESSSAFKVQYAVKVRRHTPWSRVRCQGCRFTHRQFHSKFHSRRHSFRITLKYTTLVCMRSGNAWTMKPWQRSEWRLGFNSVFSPLWGWTVHFLHGCSPCFPVSWVNVGNIRRSSIFCDRFSQCIAGSPTWFPPSNWEI